MSFHIKITGQGSTEELIVSLQGVIAKLYLHAGSASAEWKPGVLMVQLSNSAEDHKDTEEGECRRALGVALDALNDIPNTPIRSTEFRMSYNVASHIESVLKK